MLQLQFAVEDADGSRTITVGPASLVAWERRTGRKVSQFSDGIGAEDMAWLVWHADKRAGNTTLGFDEYLETIVDLADAPAPKARSAKARSGD
jgi:hypothetical protein